MGPDLTQAQVALLRDFLDGAAEDNAQSADNYASYEQCIAEELASREGA